MFGLPKKGSKILVKTNMDYHLDTHSRPPKLTFLCISCGTLSLQGLGTKMIQNDIQNKIRN